MQSSKKNEAVFITTTPYYTMLIVCFWRKSSKTIIIQLTDGMIHFTLEYRDI